LIIPCSPSCWPSAQQVEHVLEELDVPALVRGDGDAVRVFLQRAVDDLLDRAVVAEVDHLASAALQDPAHDVDRRVVAVEEARRGHEAHLVHGLVDERLVAGGKIVHRGPRSMRTRGRQAYAMRGAAGAPARPRAAAAVPGGECADYLTFT
jgi:hypothetical protein